MGLLTRRCVRPVFIVRPFFSVESVKMAPMFSWESRLIFSRVVRRRKAWSTQRTAGIGNCTLSCDYSIVDQTLKQFITKLPTSYFLFTHSLLLDKLTLLKHRKMKIACMMVSHYSPNKLVICDERTRGKADLTDLKLNLYL